MSISQAIRDAGADIHEAAQQLLNLSLIDDVTFTAFIEGFGVMTSYFLFESLFGRGTVLEWQKGQQLPSQTERRQFLEEARDTTHPSLM
jgi:hypothetical protein